MKSSDVRSFKNSMKSVKLGEIVDSERAADADDADVDFEGVGDEDDDGWEDGAETENEERYAGGDPPVCVLGQARWWAGSRGIVTFLRACFVLRLALQ